MYLGDARAMNLSSQCLAVHDYLEMKKLRYFVDATEKHGQTQDGTASPRHMSACSESTLHLYDRCSCTQRYLTLPVEQVKLRTVAKMELTQGFRCRAGKEHRAEFSVGFVKGKSHLHRPCLRPIFEGHSHFRVAFEVRCPPTHVVRALTAPEHSRVPNRCFQLAWLEVTVLVRREAAAEIVVRTYSRRVPNTEVEDPRVVDHPRPPTRRAVAGHCRRRIRRAVAGGGRRSKAAEDAKARFHLRCR